MRLLLSLLFVAATVALPFFNVDEENHVFGVNRVFLEMSEESQQLRKLKAMTERKITRTTTTTPEPEIEPDQSETATVTFKTNISCKKDINKTDVHGKTVVKQRDMIDFVDITNVLVYEDGELLGDVENWAHSYIEFKDVTKKLKKERYLTFTIQHRGCISSRYGDNYEITKVNVVYIPSETRIQHIPRIDLADKNITATRIATIPLRIIRTITNPFRWLIQFF